MARVRAISIGGIDLWICPGDHEPPHFHARKPGAWSAKVYIQESVAAMIRSVKPANARIRGADRRAIVNAVEKQRIALLEEWEASQTG